jgi:hypothetical protein
MNNNNNNNNNNNTQVGQMTTHNRIRLDNTIHMSVRLSIIYHHMQYTF